MRIEGSYVLLIMIDIIGEDKVTSVIKDKPELMELFNGMMNSSQIIQNSRIDNVSSLIEGSRINERMKVE